jgi:hypothetical protein
MVARLDHYNIDSTVAGPVMRRGYEHVVVGVQLGGLFAFCPVCSARLARHLGSALGHLAGGRGRLGTRRQYPPLQLPAPSPPRVVTEANAAARPIQPVDHRSDFRSAARLRNWSAAAAPSPGCSAISFTGARPANGALRDRPAQPCRRLTRRSECHLDLGQIGRMLRLASGQMEPRPLARRRELAGIIDQAQRVGVCDLQAVHCLSERTRREGPHRCSARGCLVLCADPLRWLLVSRPPRNQGWRWDGFCPWHELVLPRLPPQQRHAARSDPGARPPQPPAHRMHRNTCQTVRCAP